VKNGTGIRLLDKVYDASIKGGLLKKYESERNPHPHRS
jgi:hypothetical protein